VAEGGEGVANRRVRKREWLLGFLGAVLLLGIPLLGFAEVGAAFQTSSLQFSALVLLLPLSLLDNGALGAGLAVLSARWMREAWRRESRWAFWSGALTFGCFLALLLIIEIRQVLEVVSLTTLHDLQPVMEASVLILCLSCTAIGLTNMLVRFVGEMRQLRRLYKAIMAEPRELDQVAHDQPQRETKLKADDN
jgi:hypothetical protein